MERPANIPSSFITQAISIAIRRKWVIIGCVIGAMVLGVVVTLLMTPRYTASTLIEIQREQGSLINVDSTKSLGPLVDQEFYQTQYGLLESQALAERVATTLRLVDDPTFFVLFGNRAAEDWFSQGRVAAGAPSRERRVTLAGEILRAHIKVMPERLSRLVTLRFTSPDATLSKRIVDSWAQSFIQITLERRYQSSSYAREFLEQRLEQLRKRIDQSERQAVDYASRERIVSVPGAPNANGGEAGERPLVADNLAVLNRDLAAATAARIQIESRLGQSDSAEALGSTSLAALRQRRSELAGDYARMMAQFEPGYPPAQAIQNQIRQLDRSIRGEEARIGGSLRQTYESARTVENELRRRVAEAQTGVLDFRRRSIQYNIIQRDVDTNRQLYDALLQQYKAIGIGGGVSANNISIVDAAELPNTPSSPIVTLNLLLAMLAGLAIGIGAAWILEQIDQGISDPNEVEPLLGTPLLGTTPRTEGENLIAVLQDRKSALGEAYASLLTRLNFATDHGMPRVLAVTSSRAGEGKSTTSYALALMLARSGRPVLLIDADMRSPSINKILGLPNKHGLSNYLAGTDDLANLIAASPIGELAVMTTGPQPPSAPELLSGGRFDLLLRVARERFDYIVIDAPPVMGLADAPLIGSHAEGVVMVAEAASTHRNAMKTAIARLIAAHSPVLGVLLSKYDPKRSGYSYGYGYGYEYGNKDARA